MSMSGTMPDDFTNRPPSVSACLIVRNEAHRLARCLDSLQGVVDEIIIVDTGSTDQTVEMARRYTDKVFQNEWNDHFGEARNVSLALASCDWILIIDADEVLPAETARLIPTYLSRPDFQNKPLVLNWLVCSERQKDLYSRGLFPNGYGIHFVGRVHEIPVLPEQALPAYNCEELVIKHSCSESPNLLKEQYYQTLMKQELAEVSDPKRINHLQKHLGLSHVLLEEWASAWSVLSACHRGMGALGIKTCDGFYKEVLRGLVQTGRVLECPETARYVAELASVSTPVYRSTNQVSRLKMGKVLVGATLSFLAACQAAPTSRPVSPVKPIPLLLSPETLSPPVSNSLSINQFARWGDFRIQEFCQSDIDAGYACYGAGGVPVSGPKSTDPDGTRCATFAYCVFDEPEPTPTPPDDGGEDDDGCVQEPGGPPCVILPGGGGEPIPTPSPESGSEDCEDAPLLLPEEITPLIEDMSRIQPLDPATMNKHQQLIEKMKVIETQLAAYGVQVSPPNPVALTAPNPPQGFQTQASTATTLPKQAQRMLSRYEELRTEHEQYRGSIEQTMQEINISLEALLQHISDEFEVEYHQPESEPSFSLEDYKENFDVILGNAQFWLSEKNTYSQVSAVANFGNLVLLYHQLNRDIWSGELPGEESANQEKFDYYYENIQQIESARALANFVSRKIVGVRMRVQEKHSQLINETEILIEEAERTSIELNVFESELAQLEVELAEAADGFSTQSTADGPMQRDMPAAGNGVFTGYTIPSRGIGSRSRVRTPSSRSQSVKQTTNNNVQTANPQLLRAQIASQRAYSQRQIAGRNLQSARRELEAYLRRPQPSPEVVVQLQINVAVEQGRFDAAVARDNNAKKAQEKASNNNIKANQNAGKVDSNCTDCHKQPGYTPPPKNLPAFPDAQPAKAKTPVQGGGGLRKRWKDKDFIYEWDSRHGEVEKYSRNGRTHKGSFNHITGEQLKPGDPTRRVEP